MGELDASVFKELSELSEDLTEEEIAEVLAEMRYKNECMETKRNRPL